MSTDFLRCAGRGPVSWLTLRENVDAYFIHLRRGSARDARQGCEPPPASQRQGARHPVRRSPGRPGAGPRPAEQIGRASCRERVESAGGGEWGEKKGWIAE